MFNNLHKNAPGHAARPTFLMIKFDLDMDKNLALETLKSFVENTDNVIAKDAILALHPELAESEDERIIRMIKKVIYDCNEGNEHMIGDKEVVLIMDWLEKQKEQKPYEPKDWPADKDALTQEQPEVDLEKELKNERTTLLDAFGPMNGEQSLAIRNFARHFYELGLNARKEE